MRRAWCVVAGLMVSASAAVAQQTVTLAGRSVWVWRPPTTASAPLIVFSHAAGGCPGGSGFLMKALAARGYFAIAPKHVGALCPGVSGRGRGGRGNGGEWSDTTYADRRDDILAIIDAMRADTLYANHILFTQLGLVGHLAGGYTVLGLGGGWPSWKLSGVKGILALAPNADPFLMHGSLPGIGAPVMYQAGALDSGITPTLSKPGGVYEMSPVPKYFVEFKDANRLAWTELQPALHQEIIDYSVAFLDYYVRGVGSLSALHRKSAHIATLEYREK